MAGRPPLLPRAVQGGEQVGKHTSHPDAPVLTVQKRWAGGGAMIERPVKWALLRSDERV